MGIFGNSLFQPSASTFDDQFYPNSSMDRKTQASKCGNLFCSHTRYIARVRFSFLPDFCVSFYWAVKWVFLLSQRTTYHGRTNKRNLHNLLLSFFYRLKTTDWRNRANSKSQRQQKNWKTCNGNSVTLWKKYPPSASAHYASVFCYTYMIATRCRIYSS